MRKVRFIGLDVHADTIAVAVAEPDGEVRSQGMIPNRPESIRKLMKKLGQVVPHQAATFTTRVPAILSCRAWPCSVTAAMRKPNPRIAAEMSFDQ